MTMPSDTRITPLPVLLKGALIALAGCGAVTLGAAPFAATLDHANIVMAYLLAVTLVAMWLGRAPGVIASFASVLLFDFFFVEPRFSFAVQDAQFLIVFAVMLAVALIVAELTARLRREAEQATVREVQARALYRLAHDLSGALDLVQVRQLVVAFVDAEFAVDSELLLLGADGSLESAQPPPTTDSPIARRVLETGNPAQYVEVASGALALALPLNAPIRRRGVLVVRTRERDVAVPASQRPLLETVAALASTAIERIHFVAVAHDAQVQMESERLRNSMLSAVSHDLRTPLTVVVGLADTLAASESSLPPELGRTAGELRDQALRLNRMVENLLDLARLRSGKVQLRKIWQPLEEVIGSSVGAAEASYPGRAIRIAIAPDLPLLEFDGVLIERVLVNLLDNALKYGAGSPVTISATNAGRAVEIRVEDGGPGLPAGHGGQLFELFERGHAGEEVSGSGLGLAICRTIVEAHGGAIRGDNRDGGGARFTVSLPVTPPPPTVQAALAPTDDER
jgi:two-component system sensor histidine kinase KdpD